MGVLSCSFRVPHDPSHLYMAPSTTDMSSKRAMLNQECTKPGHSSCESKQCSIVVEPSPIHD